MPIGTSHATHTLEDNWLSVGTWLEVKKIIEANPLFQAMVENKNSFETTTKNENVCLKH